MCTELGRVGIATDYKYAGFISYAHADEAVAARLQRALETFKAPKNMDREVAERLSPLFRDTTELTAHHSLSEKIQDAVNGSRFLIVLCSPAAKNSHWVNEEIRLFRAVQGEASIVCVLVEGVPDTSFPPALLEGGREPLAANLGQSRDSFRLGVTQLAASMLGVGLDSLIQRAARRRRRRLQGVTAVAVAFSAFMATTTFTAVNARKAAETNRMQAEGLVKYMITDLKAKLEPVGRLSILDSVGVRALRYYDAQDIDALPDDSLARQAKARHILVQVALDAGDIKKARVQIEAAARVTKEVYNRNPDDTDAIFSHAQSEYWVGEIYLYDNVYQGAMQHFQTYAELADILHQKDPSNYDWVMEKGWGLNNMARVLHKLGKIQDARANYLEAKKYFEDALEISPDSILSQKEIANALAGLSQTSLNLEDIAIAKAYRMQQIEIYSQILEGYSDNSSIRFRYVQALSHLITDGLIDNTSDALMATLEQTYQQYEILLTQDPTNVTWRNDYILYLTEVLKYIERNNLTFIDRKMIEGRIENATL